LLDKDSYEKQLYPIWSKDERDKFLGDRSWYLFWEHANSSDENYQKNKEALLEFANQFSPETQKIVNEALEEDLKIRNGEPWLTLLDDIDQRPFRDRYDTGAYETFLLSLFRGNFHNYHISRNDLPDGRIPGSEGRANIIKRLYDSYDKRSLHQKMSRSLESDIIGEILGNEDGAALLQRGAEVVGYPHAIRFILGMLYELHAHIRTDGPHGLSKDERMFVDNVLMIDLTVRLVESFVEASDEELSEKLFSLKDGETKPITRKIAMLWVLSGVLDPSIYPDTGKISSLPGDDPHLEEGAAQLIEASRSNLMEKIFEIAFESELNRAKIISIFENILAISWDRYGLVNAWELRRTPSSFVRFGVFMHEKVLNELPNYLNDDTEPSTAFFRETLALDLEILEEGKEIDAAMVQTIRRDTEGLPNERARYLENLGGEIPKSLERYRHALDWPIDMREDGYIWGFHEQRIKSTHPSPIDREFHGQETHIGLEILVDKRDNAVVAVLDGIVEPTRKPGEVYFRSNYGSVFIRSSSGLSAYYPALDDVTVKPGDQVRAGQVIGEAVWNRDYDYNMWTPVEGTPMDQEREPRQMSSLPHELLVRFYHLDKEAYVPDVISPRWGDNRPTEINPLLLLKPLYDIPSDAAMVASKSIVIQDGLHRDMHFLMQ